MLTISGALVVRCAANYNVTGCRSWNCIKVPGVITKVPAVNPCRDWRPVVAG